MTCDEVRSKLTAYADSELNGGELAECESHLRGCAGCAAEALGLLQIKAATRAAGMRYAPSAEFRRRMEQSLRPKRSSSWWAGVVPKFAMAAVAAVLLIASVALWVGHRERQRDLAELMDMHVAALASPNPADVISTDRHTVKPWFAGKLPFSFNLPELQNSEFTLDGGRVAYLQHSSGAQLFFHVRKHQLSVFIFKDEAGEFPFHAGSATSLAFHMESWSEAGLRYFIVSDAPASDVHALGVLLKNAARS